MSRRRNIAALILIALGAALVGWIAGSNVVSPAEAAARTAPPVASPILVPIEERTLTTDVVARGTARFGLPQTVTVVPSALKQQVGLVTTLPVIGTSFEEGAMLFSASGRPVFVLQGSHPVYRDLRPGMTGEDVLQLEEALQRLGFNPGPIDGIYDELTSAAVSAWYTASGWEPFGPTKTQQAAIQEIEKQLATAIQQQQTAADAVTAAPLTVDAAYANAKIDNANADALVNAKTAARDMLARTASTSVDSLATADAELNLAIAQQNATRLSGEVAIQGAIDAKNAAQRDLATAKKLVATLTSDLELLRSQTGIQVPSDEIVFLPSVPVRVDQLNVAIGDSIGSIMTVTNNQLAIDSSLPLDEAPLVQSGMTVQIDEPSLGISATGIVERIAETPGTFGADGYHVYFEVRVQETNMALDGISLRLTIPIESTGGSVLTVPVSALSLTSDGSSRIQVDNNGTLEFVTVTPGLSADGYVEVVPENGTLTVGQMVVIGFEQR